MPTYTVMQRKTTAVTGGTGAALSRDAAVAAAAAVAATGPTGTEGHVYTCDLVSMSGPTGTYRSTFNSTGPLLGATFSATSHDDAVQQATVAGPTGPGAGTDIWSVTP